MSAGQETKEALEANVTLVGLVSTRIYPDQRPEQDALPSVVFGRVGTEYVRSISGDVLLTRAQMAVVCMATTRSQAELVADAALTGLLAEGFNPTNRESDLDPESGTHLVTVFVEHIQA